MLEGTYNLILDQDLHLHTSLVTSLVLMCNSQSQISKHTSIAYSFYSWIVGYDIFFDITIVLAANALRCFTFIFIV